MVVAVVEEPGEELGAGAGVEAGAVEVVSLEVEGALVSEEAAAFAESEAESEADSEMGAALLGA